MKKITKFQVMQLLVAGMVIGGLAVSQLGWLPNSRAESELPTLEKRATGETITVDANLIKNLNNVFTDIADKANHSVVTIFTDKVLKTGGSRSPYASPFFNDPFQDFFGDDFFNRFFTPRLPEQERHLRGMGSGVIVSDDGYILTNNHVVKDADKVRIMFMDGKKVDAEIIGTDAKTDIAVLLVKKKNLTPIEFGDSDQVRVGELPEETSTVEAKKDLVDKLGFSVQALDERLANRFGLDTDEKGVVITEIRSGSVAFKAGLRQGDVIKKINRKPVNTVSEFSEIVAELNSGEKALFYIKRKTNSFFVVLEVE